MTDAVELTGEITPKWSGRQDTRMICQAILNGWEIPESEKPEILAHLRSVLKTGKGRNPVSVHHSCPREEIRCQFIILARKDQPTPDDAKK